MPVFTTADGEPVLAIKLQGNLDFGELHVEAYHLALLLGYSQQHSIRKQVLTDWQDIFEEDVDYRIVHDEQLLRRYEDLHEEFVGPIRAMKPERGRMFLTASGIRKVFWHSSKEVDAVKEALASLLQDAEVGLAPPSFVDPTIFGTRDPRARQDPEPEGAGSDVALERQRQYDILEKLIDHLRHIKEPALRRLAITSAELGLGRQLPDVRALLEETKPQKAEAASSPTTISPLQVDEVVPSAPEVPIVDESDKVALEYLEKRPVTQGAFFPAIRNVHYGLKQIGEKAGGYSAVQAGKAADRVAATMGYSHDDIRQRQLEFNELPSLPDNTSGKLRKMYRFNSEFANRVIKELRANPEFVPTAPRDLTPFGQRTAELPKLSKGPFED